MPNCFTLTRKGETEPSKLSAVDDALCAHLGVEPDAEQYHASWVDLEGFALAMGRDWAWMRVNFPDRLDIIGWLEENYIPDSWVEVGRR